MECALPIGLAWLLQYRQAHLLPKTKRSQKGPHDTRRWGSHQQPPNQGQQPRLADAGGMEDERTTAEVPAVLDFQYPSPEYAVSGRELKQLQWMLLCLSVVQLAMRSGLWERLFQLTAVNFVLGVREISTFTLKAVLSPIMWCSRPLMRRRRRPRAIPPAAAHAAAASPAPVATAMPAAGHNSPQSGSDMEELGALQARPAHIIIISRPQLLCSSQAAAANACVDIACPRQPVHDEAASSACQLPEVLTPGVSLSAWNAHASGPAPGSHHQRHQHEQPCAPGGSEERAAGQPGSVAEIQGEAAAEPAAGSAPVGQDINGLLSEADAEAEGACASLDLGSTDSGMLTQASGLTLPLPAPAAALECVQPALWPAAGDAQPSSVPEAAAGDAQPSSPPATAAMQPSAFACAQEPTVPHCSKDPPLDATCMPSGLAHDPQPGPSRSTACKASSSRDGGGSALQLHGDGRPGPSGSTGAPAWAPGAVAAEAGAAAGGALRFLDVPVCVSGEVLRMLDTDARRALRAVSRGLYFEASRHLTHLTVQQDNLETLVYMPMHLVFPSLAVLTFVSGSPAPPPLGADEPPPQQPLPLAPTLLCKLFRECLPHLRCLSEVDVTEASFHTSPQVWDDLVSGLPKHQPILVRLREPTSWWARGATVGLPGDGRDQRDHYPPLLESLRALQRAAPSAAIDLQGVTVRRHTATRLPQLCSLAAVRHLTLFGKSSVAVPHGHRLASHLHTFVTMTNLVSLELLSYEDVSDSELAVLSNCVSLRHLYVDSLFIKLASGPVFPGITSLATARIKFILQPLTTIFPNLTKLRLGVLHSELNKKINSASVSCLAGCSERLQQLVLCPLLWKGQWQVLPTLLGMRQLSLVHCRDLIHLREVLVVVGRSPSLETLELQACSSAVAPWPGVVAGGPAAAQQDGAGDVGGVDNGDASGTDTQLLGPISENRNLFAGLSGCETLKELVIHDCTTVLVRHLAAASLPTLRVLRLQKMGPLMRLPDVQAAVLNLQGLNSLYIQDAPSISASQAHQLPDSLSRPFLSVSWQSSCRQPSLYTTRGFGLSEAGS